MQTGEITFDWKMFLFGLIVLAIVAFIIMLLVIPIKMANRRGRSATIWFLFSLIISPFLAMLFLALLGETDQKRKKRIIEEEELRMRYRN
jgi:predicted MFS family arabinose efflux permease